MKRGLLIIVSGFSGAGKGAIVKGLISKYDKYALSISATTRKPRNGECNGREYFFITKEDFEKKIANNDFLEYAKYVDNYYGTPKDYVDSMRDAGKDVILEIEMQGAMKVKSVIKDSVTVFVTTKDADTLYKRLSGRGTETPEQIRKRLMRASEETEYMSQYDYLLINEDLSKAIDNLNSIVNCEHSKSKVNCEFISQIKEDINSKFGEE